MPTYPIFGLFGDFGISVNITKNKKSLCAALAHGLNHCSIRQVRVLDVVENAVADRVVGTKPRYRHIPAI